MSLVIRTLKVGLMTNQLWLLGDDGLYHRFGVDDSGIWSGPLSSMAARIGTDFGGQKLGNAVALLAPDGLYHLFQATGNPGLWTDTDQVASVASPSRTADIARFDTALFMAGIDDDIYHKFTVESSMWVDADQGYAVPF